MAVKHFQRLRFVPRDRVHLRQVVLPVAALHKDWLRWNRGIEHSHRRLEYPRLILLAVLLRLSVDEENGHYPAAGCLPHLALHDHRGVIRRLRLHRAEGPVLQRQRKWLADERHAPPDHRLCAGLLLDLRRALHAAIASPLGLDEDGLGLALQHEAHSDGVRKEGVRGRSGRISGTDFWIVILISAERILALGLHRRGLGREHPDEVAARHPIFTLVQFLLRPACGAEQIVHDHLRQFIADGVGRDGRQGRRVDSCRSRHRSLCQSDASS